MILRQAEKKDLKKVAELVVRHCKDEKTQCVQSCADQSAENLEKEFSELYDELIFILAFEGKKLVGVLCCEFALKNGRGWTKGPFAETKNFDKTATELLAKLLELLPQKIRTLNSFLNIRNEQGNNFYFSKGFEKTGLSHVYVVLPPKEIIVFSKLCPSLEKQNENDFVKLHDSIFPQTHFSGEDILTQLDEDHKVFLYLEKNELLGYIFATTEKINQEGFIEFIGTKENFRGKGIGKELLLNALKWIFEVKKMPQTSLGVNDKLANARSLYEKVGFRLKFTGLHTRKNLDA
ncbi:GNAT family N-acetyltransferase [bacterium]|nr:GNAT family N-acetyltransferase [bacterium]